MHSLFDAMHTFIIYLQRDHLICGLFTLPPNYLSKYYGGDFNDAVQYLSIEYVSKRVRGSDGVHASLCQHFSLRKLLRCQEVRSDSHNFISRNVFYDSSDSNLKYKLHVDDQLQARLYCITGQTETNICVREN